MAILSTNLPDILNEALIDYGHDLDLSSDLTLNIKGQELVLSLHGEIKKKWSLPCRFGDVLYTISSLTQKSAQEYQSSVLLGDALYNPETGSLKSKDGRIETLTDRERDLLTQLLDQAGTASRQNLLSNVWKYADNVETHTLETHIYRLRQKIEVDSAKPKILLTEKDGYRLIYSKPE